VWVWNLFYFGDFNILIILGSLLKFLIYKNCFFTLNMHYFIPVADFGFTTTIGNISSAEARSSKSLTKTIQTYQIFWQPIWRSGRNTRLLRKRLRVRFPHSANICVHEHVRCIGSGCYYYYYIYVFFLNKQMYLSMYLSAI
jgi:hypothetical protein